MGTYLPVKGVRSRLAPIVRARRTTGNSIIARMILLIVRSLESMFSLLPGKISSMSLRDMVRRSHLTIYISERL